MDTFNEFIAAAFHIFETTLTRKIEGQTSDRGKVTIYWVGNVIRIDVHLPFKTKEVQDGK